MSLSGLKKAILEGIPATIFVIFVVFVFVAITYADYIITHVLPLHYGLVYNGMWLSQWWTCMAILLFSIACLVAVAYMQFREPTKRNWITALILWLTVFWQGFSGSEDMMWFAMEFIQHGTTSLRWDTLWTWSPFYYRFGLNWTTVEQVEYVIGMNVVLVAIWLAYIAYLKWARYL